MVAFLRGVLWVAISQERMTSPDTELRQSLRRLPKETLVEMVMRCNRGGVTLRDVLGAFVETAPAEDDRVPDGVAAARSQEVTASVPVKLEPNPDDDTRSEPASSQPMNAAQLADPVAERGCAGNCGRLACKEAQNRNLAKKGKDAKKPPICQDCCTTKHSSGRCEPCRCETIRCVGGMNGKHGVRLRTQDARWCRRCGQSAEDLANGSYQNAYGIFVLKSRWSTELRLTARLGFALVRMLPWDVEAMMHFARGQIEIRWPWHGFDMAVLIVASAMKWPHAIKAFEAALRDVRVEKESMPEVVLAECIMTATEACDDLPMTEMHSELSKTGRAGCKTGLIWCLRRLSFVLEEDDTGSQPAPISAAPLKKRLRKGNSTDGFEGRKKWIQLRKMQTAYRVELGRASVQSCRCILDER